MSNNSINFGVDLIPTASETYSLGDSTHKWIAYLKDYATESYVTTAIGNISIPDSTSDLTNDSGFITGMTILSYGSSTWQNFLDAYNANTVVYCRASSNSNPGSGAQNRLAFLAYVNTATTPTEAEFQYYRSVATHSDSQQGDQVYVYKLNSSGVWSVTVRSTFSKVAAGTGLSSSYTTDTVTLSIDSAYQLPAVTSSDNGKVLIVSSGAWSVGNVSIADATTSASGLMSSTDKTKLDGIEVATTLEIQTYFDLPDTAISAQGVSF